MQHIIEYLVQSNSTTTLLMIAITICVGTIIGKVKIMSLRIGVIAVLFSGMILGIVCGRLGIGLNADMTGILKDLGLILFIYIIGLQVGPSFFAGLKKGGLRLNLQAFVIVVLGLVITLLISEFDGVQPDMMAGIYSGPFSRTMSECRSPCSCPCWRFLRIPHLLPLSSRQLRTVSCASSDSASALSPR